MREKLALTQDQWAARLGVSPRTVSRWENGDTEPSRAQKSLILAQAGDAVPASIKQAWMEAERGGAAAIGAAAGFAAAAGGALGLAVAGGALGLAVGTSAGAITRWIMNRKDLRGQAVLDTLRDKAESAGIEWQRYRTDLSEVLILAREVGLDLNGLIVLLQQDPSRPPELLARDPAR